MDFFESILKPKKFIDVIENLTIYFDEKKENGELTNIFLNEKKDINNSQTTFAKTGTVSVKNDKKILTLYSGKSINNVDGKISEFKFSKTDYNISKFNSNTILHQKTQEISTVDLIKCSLFFKNSIENINNAKILEINNCVFSNLENIYKQLYSRL